MRFPTQTLVATGLVNALVSGRSFILLPVLVRMLDPAEYGLWATLAVTQTFASPVLTLGTAAALARYLPASTPDERRRDTWVSIAAVAIIGLFAILVISAASPPLLPPQIGGVILPFSLLVVGDALALIALNVLRGAGRMSWYNAATLLAVATELVVILMLPAGATLPALLWQITTARLVTLGVTLVFAASIAPPVLPQWRALRRLVRYGGPMVLSGMAFWLVQSSDRYLVGAFLGLDVVGHYAPAYTVGNVLTLLITPLFIVLPPLLAAPYDRGDAAGPARTLEGALAAFLAIAIPAATGLAFLGRPILELVATPAIANAASFVTGWVAWSMVLYGIYTIAAQGLLLSQRTSSLGWIWTGAAVVNAVFNIALLQWLDLLGAAMATLGAFLFAAVAAWVASSKTLPLRISGRLLLKTVLATVVMTVSVTLLPADGAARLTVSIVSGGLLYAAVFWLLGGVRDLAGLIGPRNV